MIPPDLAAALRGGPAGADPMADTGGPPGPDSLVGGPPGSGLEDTGGPPGPDALVGGPGAAPSARGPATPGAITSEHTGGALDFIRQAILSLQHFAEITDDDQELAKVHRCLVGLQSILADHARDRSAAMGESPALRHVRRTTRGAGY